MQLTPNKKLSVLNIGVKANTPSGFRPPVISIARDDRKEIDLQGYNSLTRPLIAGRGRLKNRQKKDFARYFGVGPKECCFIVLKTPTFDNYQIMFVYPARLEPLEAMQRLYQTGGGALPAGLPDVLAASLVFWSMMDESLDDRMQGWIGGIFADCTRRFFDLMAGDEEVSGLEALLLEEFLDKPVGRDGTYELSDFDMVRFVCQVGEWLWRHPLVFHDDAPDELVAVLNSLAWIWLMARQANSIEFRGELIPVVQPVRAMAWALFNGVAGLRPPQGALSFLLAAGLPQFVEPEGRSSIKITSLDHLDTEKFINEVEEEAGWTARRLEITDLGDRVDAVKSLVQDGIDHCRLEAEARGQSYIVQLPDGHPARQPGYDRVRIFHFLHEELGETMLYAFERKRGLMFTGAWFPQLDRIDGGLLTGGDLLTGIAELTVAGIWRDLVVEENGVLRPTSSEVREWRWPDEPVSKSGLAVTNWVLQPLQEVLANDSESAV